LFELVVCIFVSLSTTVNSITHRHPSSPIITHRHPSSSIITHHHPSSPIIIHHHLSSPIDRVQQGAGWRSFMRTLGYYLAPILPTAGERHFDCTGTLLVKCHARGVLQTFPAASSLLLLSVFENTAVLGCAKTGHRHRTSHHHTSERFHISGIFFVSKKSDRFPFCHHTTFDQQQVTQIIVSRGKTTQKSLGAWVCTYLVNY
jgi:hypothetical protein